MIIVRVSRQIYTCVGCPSFVRASWHILTRMSLALSVECLPGWLPFVYRWIYAAPKACFALDMTYLWKGTGIIIGFDTFDPLEVLRLGWSLRAMARVRESVLTGSCHPRHKIKMVYYRLHRRCARGGRVRPSTWMGRPSPRLRTPRGPRGTTTSRGGTTGNLSLNKINLPRPIHNLVTQGEG